MMSSRFRPLALILLLVALFCFSGAAQAGLRLLDQAPATGDCCPPVDDRSSDDPASPCTSLECQCPDCSAALVLSLIQISGVTSVSAARISRNSVILPPGFISSIDYPPEPA